MIVNVVGIYEYTALIEYVDNDGFINRKYISRGLLSSSRKEPTLIDDVWIDTGIEYSDVDLVAILGNMIENIQTRQLENALRKAGIWLRVDYANNPEIVSKIVRIMRHPSNLPDVTTILNAAHSVPDDGGLDG